MIFENKWRKDMYNSESVKNNSSEYYQKLLKSIKTKEKQALEAKTRGMHASFSLLSEEISQLKRKLRKQQMGSR